MTTLINVCTHGIWQATVIFKSAMSSVVILMNQSSLDIFNPRILCFLSMSYSKILFHHWLFLSSLKDDNKCRVVYSLKIDGIIFF